MEITEKRVIQLLKFAWKSNRINLFQFGDEIHPIQFYFVRGDLVAFRFPIEIEPGTFEESLYILRNEDLNHSKKRRAVLSIEKIENTHIVDSIKFDKMLNLLNTRCALGLNYIEAPEIESITTDSAGEKIIITFNKSMLKPQDPGEFIVIINEETNVTPVGAEFIDGDTATVLGLILPEDSKIKSSDTVEIVYERGSVISVDYGVLTSFGPIEVTNAVLIPELIGAETNAAGTAINLTFSKTMDNPGANAETDFEVKVNGSQTFVIEKVEKHTTNGEIIIITLDESNTFEPTDVISLSYSGTSIKSADGGFLQPFDDYLVTNNVT